MSTYWPGEDEHSVLVCNGIGISEPAPAGKFWEFVYALLAKYGCPISEIADKGSYKSYSRVKRRLDKILQECRMLGVRSLPPGVDNKHTLEYLAKADINLNPNNLEVILDLKSRFMGIRSPGFKETARQLIHYFRPSYCYGFSRPFCYRPSLYAVGLGDGNNPPNQRNNNWAYYGILEDNYLKGGWLREVYALNYLTDAHLSAPVGNVTLREWIQQSANRGTLTPVTEEMMLWEVPDERLTELSDQLYEAGRVFDAERDVLSKRPKPTQEVSLDEATAQVLQAFGFESPDEVEIRKGDNKPISEEEKAKILAKKKK